MAKTKITPKNGVIFIWVANRKTWQTFLMDYLVTFLTDK